MKAAPRILVVKPSSLGDIVHTLPLAHALKRGLPDCRIGWVVERAFAPLLAADPAIDTVHAIHIPATSNPDAGRGVYWDAFRALLTTMRALRAACRAAPYDYVLDLQASFRSGLLSLANPGGRRIGFADARELNTLFQHERIAVPPYLTHALDKNNLFAAPFGSAVAPEDFYLATTDEAEAAVDAFLRAAGLAGTRPVYAQVAARWPSKEWLPEGWAELADALADAGHTVVFGGSPGDLPLLERIAAMMQTTPHIAAGKLNLPAAAALIKRSRLYVGVDTGPMHMAALASVPVLALFGPTHPERVGPYRNTKSRILRAENLGCLCCRKRQCDHHSCMRGIGTGMVLEAARKLLVETGGEV